MCCLQKTRRLSELALARHMTEIQRLTLATQFDFSSGRGRNCQFQTISFADLQSQSILAIINSLDCPLSSPDNVSLSNAATITVIVYERDSGQFGISFKPPLRSRLMLNYSQGLAWGPRITKVADDVNRTALKSSVTISWGVKTTATLGKLE